MMTLSLQEVLIVGASSDQVKFSELTLDMFRMLQTLEREPQEDLTHMYDVSPGPGRLPPMVCNLHFKGTLFSKSFFQISTLSDFSSIFSLSFYRACDWLG